MWQQELISELRQIDAEQTPHGLYGLQAELSSTDRPLSPGQAFGHSTPRTNLVRRLRGVAIGKPRYSGIGFRLGPSQIFLTIETVALTKCLDPTT